MPPRATLPKRRCTPSTRGEYTKISYSGFGSGNKLDPAALEFDRDGVLRMAVFPDLIEIGAERGRHQRAELAQDAVLVETVDGLQHFLDFREDRGLSAVAIRRRIRLRLKAQVKQLDDFSARPRRACSRSSRDSPGCKERRPAADSARACAPARRRATRGPR